MIMWTAYIVPTAMLQESRPNAPHDAHPIPADPSQSLVRVRWENTNHEREFEALAGVESLGLPWEPVDPVHATLLASFAPQSDLSLASSKAIALTEGAQSLSVARALRGIGWR